MGIVYLIFRIYAWFVSILPFSVIYLISDFHYFLIYHVIGYRRKVVYQNLRSAFPEKDKKEINKIARKFYRNLSDIVLEVLKIKNFSEKEQDRRILFENFEIIEDLYKKGKSIFVAIGHCGNWEWMGPRLARITRHHPYAIVKPLTDPFFEDYMNMLRTKSGYNNLIKFKQAYRTLYKLKEQDNIVIIASDQTPTRDEINYWTNFMGQETGFFLGLEKMSKSLDYAVLFFDIVRERRGHYRVFIEEITREPAETGEYEITDKYVGMLESAIKARPDNWLWSHRRWKHKREQTENHSN